VLRRRWEFPIKDERGKVPRDDVRFIHQPIVVLVVMSLTAGTLDCTSDQHYIS
jgi:hypothetical protein